MQVRFEDIPPEWGFQRGDLPPLGASPDAVLRYPHRTELMHNAPLLDDRAAPPVRQSASPQPGRQQSTVQHPLPGASMDSGSAEPPAVSDGLEHIEELLQKLHFQQTASLSALGTLAGSPSTAAAGKSGAAGSPGRAQSDLAGPQARLCSSRAHSTHSAAAEPPSRAQEAREQLDAQEQQWGPAGLVEMVEIKNTSPFGELTGGRMTKKGKSKGFCLNDRGPRIVVRASSLTHALPQWLCVIARPRLLLKSHTRVVLHS